MDKPQTQIFEELVPSALPPVKQTNKQTKQTKTKNKNTRRPRTRWCHGSFCLFINTRLFENKFFFLKVTDRSNKTLKILYKRITANTSAV